MRPKFISIACNPVSRVKFIRLVKINVLVYSNRVHKYFIFQFFNISYNFLFDTLFESIDLIYLLTSDEYLYDINKILFMNFLQLFKNLII